MSDAEEEINQLREDVQKLTDALRTLVVWSARDLGHDNALTLVGMLPDTPAPDRQDE